MSICRTVHWATRELHAFLSARATAPFAWGSNDCALFAADAIQAFTGTDIAAEFRGRYTDRASAFALIRQVTGKGTVADAAAWCAERHGLAEYPNPRFAQRGDLVIVDVASDDGTELAGLVHTNGQVVTVSEKGPLLLPISKAVRAWKI